MVDKKELLQLLDAAVDGIDGYEAETGYLRYWNPAKIHRARRVLDKHFNTEDRLPSGKFGEIETNALASILGGYTWHSGGGIFVVLIKRSDGHIVSITDECICEYKSQDAFDENLPLRTINIGRTK